LTAKLSSGQAMITYCKAQTDRGLPQDSIQEELEDEHLQFKGPMARTRSKRLEDQSYSRLLMGFL